MKHIFAILFILIHLFNLGGYQLVFDQLEINSGRNMVARLDNNQYSDDQLIEVRIPIQLPYQANRPDFERYDGEIELNGVHYNYVKRKMQNDTLILLCIPNMDKSKISTARETFFSLVNDINQANDAKQSPAPVKTVKLSVAEFNTVQYAGIGPAVSTRENYPPVLSDGHCGNGFTLGIVKPPQALA